MRKIFWILLPCLFLIACTEEKVDSDTSLDLEINLDKPFYVVGGSSYDGYPYQIYKLSTDTIEALINDPSQNYWGLRLSNDKTKFICFISDYEGTNDQGYNEYTTADLWIFNIDGTGGEILVDRVAEDFYSLGAATWHPNNDQIIFASRKNGADTKTYLWAINTDGTDLKQISERDVRHENPVLNAAGDKIVYIAFPNGSSSIDNAFEIYLTDYDHDTKTFASSEKRITENEVEEEFPSISADGNFISYNKLLDSGTKLYTVSVYDINLETTTDIIANEKYSKKNSYWEDDKTFYYEENIILKSNFYVSRYNTASGASLRIIRDLNAHMNFKDYQEL